MGLTQYGPVLRETIVYAFFPRFWETDSHIVKSTLDVALSLKSEENKISISRAPRNHNLNNKAEQMKNYA